MAIPDWSKFTAKEFRKLMREAYILDDPLFHEPVWKKLYEQSWPPPPEFVIDLDQLEQGRMVLISGPAQVSKKFFSRLERILRRYIGRKLDLLREQELLDELKELRP